MTLRATFQILDTFHMTYMRRQTWCLAALQPTLSRFAATAVAADVSLTPSTVTSATKKALYARNSALGWRCPLSTSQRGLITAYRGRLFNLDATLHTKTHRVLYLIQDAGPTATGLRYGGCKHLQ